MKKIRTEEEVKARIIKNAILTADELSEIEMAAQITCALLDARKEKKLSQKELEKLSGVRQQVIARLESGSVNPKISTVNRLLRPLGKKLIVVDA
jgi:DNA-binding XRE family transcriptional regulator